MDIGATVGRILPFDPTPNFQLSRNGGALPGVGYDSAALQSRVDARTPDRADSSAINRAAAALRGGGASTPDDGGGYTGGGYTAAQQAAAQQQAEANALYDSQERNLNDLLGRVDGGLNQGLSKLNDDYQGNVNQQNSAKSQALQDYSDKRVSTNKDKLAGYGQVNKNANNGYRSLAQIIGRNAGTGSSAFQELLPDVIGKDVSAKRGQVNDTFAANIGNIDNAQKKTELSFQSILDDLSRQRQAGERDLRSGVEGQRQSLLGQQQQLQASRGNVDAVRGIQGQIEGSRGAVENFFNQFNPGIKAGQATVAAPDLAQYQVDRSNINAQQAGGNPENPYAEILRKKLQDQAV